MKTVYADALVLLNAAIDYLLLLSAARLAALPLRRGRMGLAAAWGGAYALLAVLWPGLFGLGTVKLLAGAITAVIAFGLGRRSLRAIAAFFGVSAAFAGTLYALGSLAGVSGGKGLYMPVSLRTLALSFATGYAVISLLLRYRGRARPGRVRRVELSRGGRSAVLDALEDTGNALVDPVTGRRVLVAAAPAVAALFPLPEALSDPDPLAALEALNAAGARLRLLPCATAAAGGALLLCFTPDSLRVDGRAAELAVAVSPRALSPAGDFQGLLPPEEA